MTDIVERLERAEAVIGAAVEVLTIKSSVLSRFWEAKEAHDKERDND